MITKPNDAQDCIVDAGHILDLIEMAADWIVEGHSEEPAPVKAATISAAARMAREKLADACELLHNAEAKAQRST